MKPACRVRPAEGGKEGSGDTLKNGSRAILVLPSPFTFSRPSLLTLRAGFTYFPTPPEAMQLMRELVSRYRRRTLFQSRQKSERVAVRALTVHGQVFDNLGNKIGSGGET